MTMTETTARPTNTEPRHWLVSVIDGRLSTVAFVTGDTAHAARSAAEALVDERSDDPLWALGAVTVTSADDTREIAWTRAELPSCVRCRQRPEVGDAAAHEISYARGCFPSVLDDHCEKCLPAGLAALDDTADFEHASDIAARA